MNSLDKYNYLYQDRAAYKEGLDRCQLENIKLNNGVDARNFWLIGCGLLLICNALFWYLEKRYFMVGLLNTVMGLCCWIRAVWK